MTEVNLDNGNETKSRFPMGHIQVRHHIFFIENSTIFQWLSKLKFLSFITKVNPNNGNGTKSDIIQWDICIISIFIQKCSSLSALCPVFFFHQMIALHKMLFFHLRSSFRARDIQIFSNFSLPFHTFQIQKDNFILNFQTWSGNVSLIKECFWSCFAPEVRLFTSSRFVLFFIILFR